jgi:L-seryl-tRNA(Ser) seleniumtransferase
VSPSGSLALLPRVDRVVAHAALSEARARLGVVIATRLAREAIDAARSKLLEGDGDAAPPTEDEVAAAAARSAQAWLGTRARRVVNATGIMLHTNLGRAPLAPAAVRALEATGGYVSLEIDLATGKRGRRGAFAEKALCELTGAESAMVVNNGAAAILLLATACLPGRDVLVSRGELVEIGGGFRVPEIIARSGARLVEVGSTNRTRAADYARALEERTAPAAILRVHQANFRQVGFVERPSIPELVALARASGALLVEDQGSGAHGDLSGLGLGGEPVPRAALEAGVDAVTFSTDKLLGGPQGGVVAGRVALVDRARRDPLARALRLGRLPLVALEATLEAWLTRGEAAIPTLARARLGEAAQRARVEHWRVGLAAAGIACEVVSTRGEMGGGAQPGEGVPSAALRVPSRAAHDLAARLRACDPAVLVRIEDGAILVDALAIAEGEERELVVALLAVLVGEPG